MCLYWRWGRERRLGRKTRGQGRTAFEKSKDPWGTQCQTELDAPLFAPPKVSGILNPFHCMQMYNGDVDRWGMRYNHQNRFVHMSSGSMVSMSEQNTAIQTHYSGEAENGLLSHTRLKQECFKCPGPRWRLEL